MTISSYFQAGQSYRIRFVGDADATTTAKVVTRTAKTVRVIIEGQQKTLRVAVRDGVETVKPFGSYSMAPVMSAARPA